MPIYAYQCEECEKEFEVVESMKHHDTKEHQCPSCGSPRVERVISQVFAKTSRKA